MNGHAASPAPKLALRADLIKERIRMGKTFYWVLKDPLARAYYYFSDREFAILKLLDGRRRLNEITQECSQQFAPDYVAPESIVGFLADATDKGLVRLTGATPKDASSTVDLAAKRSWLSYPLAIRLPGINPDRTLDRVAEKLHWLVNPVSLIIWLAVVGFALLFAVVHFKSLVEHIALAAGRTGAPWWLTLLIVISATKIVHELAHAIVCKLMGAECREVGVMLLLGVPCLYCDVSDAWMLKERWKRVFVSFAGIAAELVIAAIAVFLWHVSESAVLRDISVSVIVVCSVSTVVFNGNPLLRYDGYFILSDLIGIPNLSSESSSLIRNWFRRLIWSLPKAGGETAQPDRRLTMAIYGVLSGIYRAFVLLFIAMLVYRFAGGFGLHTIGGLVAMMMVVAMIRRSVKPILTAPPQATRRSAAGAPRRRLLVVGSLLVAAVCLFVPLKQTVQAPVLMMPADAKEIVVTVPGVLDSFRTEGDLGESEVIATLKNTDVAIEQLRKTSEMQRLQTTLSALEQRQAFDSSASAKIPATQKSLEAAVVQSNLAKRELDRLSIRSPSEGMFFAPPNRIPLSPDEAAQSWIGIPLELANRGAYLDSGTLLGIVGDAHRREAFALVRQQEIELIRVGQAVNCWSASGDSHRGRVIEIAASPTKQVPRELIAAGHIVQPSPVTNDVYYRVRIELNQATNTPPVRSTARASITTKPTSILHRIVRAISTMFRVS